MRVQFLIPVLASILILGTLVTGITQDVFAPKGKKEIEIEQIKWNAETHSFDIKMSAQFGMVKAIQNADFSILVELTITSPDLPGGSLSLTPQNFSGEEIFPDEVGRIKVQFHWDRSLPDGSTFEEIAVVTTTAQILNPAGNPVGNGSDTIDETIDFDSR